MCVGCIIRGTSDVKKQESGLNGERDAKKEKSRNIEHDHWRLITYHELPDWMKDNEFILAFYRPHMNSIWSCFTTGIFQYHNESVNIWSHLLGLVLFLFFIYLVIFRITASENGVYSSIIHQTEEDITSSPSLHALVTTHQHSIPSIDDLSLSLRTQPRALRETHPDGISHFTLHKAYSNLLLTHRAAMVPMLLSACLCFTGSTLYHILWNHSIIVMKVFSRLDYAGIVLLILGHSCMASFYLFYCRPGLAFRYNLVNLLIAIPLIVSFFHPRFEFPEFRKIRAILFVSFGILGGFPLLHSGILHSFSRDLFLHHLFSLGISGLFYLLGALLFASRIPERFAPGKFDTWWNSHNWLHFCVIAGAIVHWVGCIQEMSIRMVDGCIGSPL